MKQMQPLTAPTLPLADEIEYPESDGEPMGETGFHVKAILSLCQSLMHYFRHATDVYVTADMFFYYEEGNPKANKVPDVFVARGVSPEERRTYKLWEEGVPPCAIFEVTSLSTRREDLTTKKELYERLGVQEYFLFDPLDEYLSPRLQGYRLVGGRYEALIAAEDGSLESENLGVWLKGEGILLRVTNIETGELVPDLDEASDLIWEARRLQEAQAQRAEEEAQRAEEEAQRAEEEARRAEEEAQRAEAQTRRAEEEAQRAEEEARRAEEEAQRAEEEARRAEEEAQRAEAAETKLTQLEVEVEELRRQLRQQDQDRIG